jgi:hypothetical protein
VLASLGKQKKRATLSKPISAQSPARLVRFGFIFLAFAVRPKICCFLLFKNFFGERSRLRRRRAEIFFVHVLRQHRHRAACLIIHSGMRNFQLLLMVLWDRSTHKTNAYIVSSTALFKAKVKVVQFPRIVSSFPSEAGN